MEKIINMIQQRISKLEEIREKREHILKISQDESTQAYNAGSANALRQEVKFLESLLAEMEKI